MLPTDRDFEHEPEEGSTAIRQQINEVLARLHFGDEECRVEKDRVPLRVLLRKHMIESIGPEWAKCTLIVHTLPTGEQIYTASRLCIACGKVHTFVLCRDGDDFYIAAPSPVRRDDF